MTAPLEFLKPSEVAAKLRVSPMTVYRLIHAEELRATRVGRSYRIPVRLTETTVKTHAKRLFVALGARDRAHAVALSVSGQVAITVRHTQQLRSAS